MDLTTFSVGDRVRVKDLAGVPGRGQTGTVDWLNGQEHIRVVIDESPPRWVMCSAEELEKLP